MRLLTARAWIALKSLVYQRIILLLTVLFCVGVGVAMANMSHLSSDIIESQALQSATLYAQAMKEARTLYSSKVVSNLKELDNITVTHDYALGKGAIPLPATFLIELGQHISRNHAEISVRLYSDYPFPWRQAEGGPRDDFEQEALNYLKANPNGSFFRTENQQGKSSFRYAEADLMKPSCVTCHNTHADSPKTDWKEGDVRGILEITQPLQSITQQTQKGLQQLLMLLVGISVLGLSGLAIAIHRLRNNAKDLEQRVKERTFQLQEANQELIIEQEKSENLLLNILPPTIAEKLKEGHSNIADGFAEVTILFADIVGFTDLSKRIPPAELVKMLNHIFSGFDELTERHSLEKIKTIGDAYMVVGGLPTLRPDHAETVAEMALDMLHEMNQFNEKYGTAINLRIGINTGPAVAGVIGTKKFIYDLWGDAVNTASRMESHGIPGAIQVTQETYEILKHKYVLQHRGIIHVKGKGDMTTYFLLDRLVCNI
ncbi:adenylate/guanylate cyclase domain-containing protein [Planktothrix paucivesiculata]|uniref:Adenylate cyclase n=1 Tax=Planktothrix paucivesiculata PCC 9631 TaxID=671071 RepID=A0A7Z9BMJ9_9CYAN|nr:adenylate/guanylate cyclase domain-containing protein [Planktothrix paucivesiculata]VXD12209.1 Adenylate cyclase [Planktothrix paucivesiculata PCC 9631]